MGKPGQKVTAAEFREKCREYAAGQVEGQKESFKRLGILGEWDKPYRTMDFVTEANIIRALGKIADNGHLLKGFKPVHWCTDCGSALAEAEVEYKTKFLLRLTFVLKPLMKPLCWLSLVWLLAMKAKAMCRL